MCSHESITWKITDNSVTDRTIDNSLIYKFNPSRKKIRRRTKVLNAQLKIHDVTDYKHYVELKTNVLRNLTTDTDTSDSSLTDVDYNIICSSPSKQAEYVTKISERYNLINEEDCEGCKKKNMESKMKKRGNSTKKRIQMRKSRTNTIVPKKYIDWQDVIRNSNTYLHKQTCTSILDNEETILKDDHNHVEAQYRKRSLSPQFNSQDSKTSKITKHGNEYLGQNHGKSNIMNNELSIENNMVSNKTKSVSKKKAENHKNQNMTMDESNTKFNSDNSHYESSPSRSVSLENNNFNNEFNTFIENKSENNSSKKLTIISNENSLNIKNHDNAYMSHKSELLKNVRRNLIPTLEKVDFTTNNNKNIEIEKNVKDDSNYDELHLSAINFNQHSTPKEIETNMSKVNDLSPNISRLDYQKDSGIDEDSQDKFVEIKGSNKIAKNCNVKENSEKIPIFSPELKKIDEVIETEEDCKKDEEEAHLKFSNDILRDEINEEEKLSEEEEMKNSSQLNQIAVEINQKDKDEHFAKTKDSNDTQKQQLLSPKQKCMKELCNYLQEEEDDRKVKESSEEKEISLRLNNDKDTEISSINHEDSLQLEDSCDIHKQQLLFPKKNHIKDIHFESHNILNKDKKQMNEEKEKKNFSELNEADKDAKMHLINEKDKTVKLENTHDVQKQQILPKVKCSEILNKKYKIINKKDNTKNNIETMYNINNTDIATEYIPIKKTTLIHYPNIIDHDTGNCQEAAINSEEIDAPIALETDNEEINVNCISPQIKKRLQQQARLNLVVSSDSNESDDEDITKTSNYRTQASVKSHSNAHIISCQYKPCNVSK